jgi:hypothetical protein
VAFFAKVASLSGSQGLRTVLAEKPQSVAILTTPLFTVFNGMKKIISQSKDVISLNSFFIL